VRLVIICPDEKLNNLSGLDIRNQVFGIREAKGLEFSDVAVVDFFSSLANPDQKAWRQLLLDDTLADGPQSFPQVETQLKLLYTAMTRSCNRLIFIETQYSMVRTNIRLITPEP
jgi:superfamily I DNA/RNA helicase